MLSKIIILCLTLSLRRTFAFSPTSPAFQTTLLLHASGGKGFGSSSPPKKKYNEESDRTIENPMAPPQNEMNEGQKALEALRRERAEQRDAELRKVKEIKSVDEYLTRTPNAAVIPEKVAVRMGKRMLPFVGLPLIGGMGSFVAFWYLATYRDMEFQPSMVAFTTIAILALGLVGITYSVMSASWDEDTEGSALGLKEFGDNLESLKTGLSRSRENARVRERMAGMSEAEIQSAINDLDKRDRPKSTITSELKELEKEQWSE